MKVCGHDGSRTTWVGNDDDGKSGILCQLGSILIRDNNACAPKTRGLPKRCAVAMRSGNADERPVDIQIIRTDGDSRYRERL